MIKNIVLTSLAVISALLAAYLAIEDKTPWFVVPMMIFVGLVLYIHEEHSKKKL